MSTCAKWHTGAHMKPGLLSGLRECLGGRRSLSGYAMVLALFARCAPRPVCAQDGQEVPQAPNERYTLHVYEDLVQMPTLVLNQLNESYAGLDGKSFSMRVDSGPVFHPRHVRLEGDDPITLAVLLDESASAAGDLLGQLDQAVSRLPQDLLTSRDHVTVYAFDCKLVRSTTDAPASLSVLQAGILNVLRSSTVHVDAQGGTKVGCRNGFHLWDAIGMVANKMHDLPGRRVMLVLSTGEDTGSKNSWEAIRAYVSGYSMAVFGFRPKTFVPQGLDAALQMRQSPIFVEDPFALLCSGTGGLSMLTEPDTLNFMLRRTIGYLRNRYILEFPRPANGEVGRHIVDVTIPDHHAIIRASGVTFPIRDKKVLSDPSTVPTNTDDAPVMGKRKVLAPH